MNNYTSVDYMIDLQTARASMYNYTIVTKGEIRMPVYS